MNTIGDCVSISLLNWDGGATGLAVENRKGPDASVRTMTVQGERRQCSFKYIRTRTTTVMIETTSWMKPTINS